MTADLTLTAIPKVLEDDELPAVIGFGDDTRRSLDIDGVEYRRGSDRCSIAWRLDVGRLRATLIEAEDNCYLVASAGPILNDWWPLLLREGGNPQRPLLSAGVAHRAETFRSGDLSTSVVIAPPGESIDATTAVIALAGRLSDECLLYAHFTSLAVIKAALLLLQEYRSLIDPVPDVDVQTGAVTLSLSTFLDVAREAANSIAWTHARG